MDAEDATGSPFAEGAVTEPPLSPEAPAGPEPPRLGILHLMVWTACVAAWLGWQRTLEDFVPRGPRSSGSMELALHAFQSLGAGMALGGLVLWIARRRKGMRFPVHPGEYLLVVTGLTVFCSNVLHTAMLLLMLCNEEAFLGRTMLFFSVFSLVLAVFPFWGCLRVHQGWWRAFFAAMVLHYFSQACCVGVFLHWTKLPRELTWLVVPAILVIPTARDHFAGRRYPWAHWAGIAAYVWLASLHAVWAIGMHLFGARGM